MPRVFYMRIIHEDSTVEDADTDDRIDVHRSDGRGTTSVWITYTYSYRSAGNRTNVNTVRFSQEGAMSYFHTLLTSLAQDMEPPFRIQTFPVIGPSVLYNVEDLDDPAVFRTIENVIWTALYAPIRSANPAENESDEETSEE